MKFSLHYNNSRKKRVLQKINTLFASINGRLKYIQIYTQHADEESDDLHTPTNELVQFKSIEQDVELREMS